MSTSYIKKNLASPGNRTRVARMGILHDTTTPATPSEESRKFIGTVYKCCHSIFVQTGTEQLSGLSQHFITQTVNYNHVISTINFPLIILRLEQYHQYGREYN